MALFISLCMAIDMSRAVLAAANMALHTAQCFIDCKPVPENEVSLSLHERATNGTSWLSGDHACFLFERFRVQFGDQLFSYFSWFSSVIPVKMLW
jgi:hypothetical protein